MDRNISLFQSITPSRTREVSQTRSLVPHPSQPGSLNRVYTAQSFDDHVAYNRQNSTSEGSPSQPVVDKTESNDSKIERKEEVDDDASSISHSNHSHVEPDVEKGHDAATTIPAENPQDPYRVTWSGPDDPENPKNWRMRKKWAAAFIVSSFTFISPVSSSMVAPALQTMSRDLGIKTEIESAMILSIFVLAYAIGPLFLGPLSEIYGRVIVLQLSNLFYLVWNLACGFARTGPEMLVFRFLSGLGGSAPLAIGGAVLGDCFSPEQRGKAISMYSLAPLLGPAIGPIVGGYITQGTTWRWIFWVTSILDALIQISGLFFLQGMNVTLFLWYSMSKLTH
jgi:multidrug resistance protein